MYKCYVINVTTDIQKSPLHTKRTICIPEGVRTPVAWMKTRCPGPLNDGDIVSLTDMRRRGIEPRTHGLKGRCSTD